MTYKPLIPVFLVILTLPVHLRAQYHSTSVASLPSARALIAAFRTELAAAENFAERNKDKSDAEFIRSAKAAELQDLQILEDKKLSAVTLWSLNEDIKFLGEYRSSGDSDYLKASINDVKSTIRANQRLGSKEQIVQITVQTTPDNGYQIWYTLSDWADLPNPPALPFDKPSEWTQSLPKDKNYTLWSQNYNDANKRGVKSPCITNESKSITIGSPPP